jgi:MFS family permease
MSTPTTVSPASTPGPSAKHLHASVAEPSPGEIAVGVIIGRTSEFFDFFVYAIASVIVFPKLVFPYLDALSGTLLSFAIFAVAFIARPFGTVMFTVIDRSYGRGVKMMIALLLLGVSTVAIAFLPGYDQIGSACALLLILFRVGQGLALGGEWDGLASLLALNAPEHRRGWYAMIPQLGAPLGLIVASALFTYFLATLPAADFLDWGWRFPFFVAFAINVVALFARLRLVETPEFARQFEALALQPSTVRETLRAEGHNIVIGAFAPLASFALFHTVTVFPLSWVFLYTRQSPGRFLTIEMLGAAVGVASIVVSGLLADRVGRRTLLGVTAGAIAAFSGFAPQLLNGGEVGEAIFMLLGFILLGLSFGQSSGTVASRFSITHRYTGSALTTDFAWLFGAGFAPFVALILASHFGLIAAGAYLLSGAICTLVALALSPTQDAPVSRTGSRV